MRGYNQGPLAGDLEMDGAHQSGRRAAEKRGKPQGSRPVTSETPVEELSSILTQAGKQKAKRKGPPKGAIDPEFGRRLRGFTRGKHREHELLHAGPRVSKASGPAKGRQPGGPPGLPR